MSWSDAFRLALRSVLRRFGRSALTVLSVALAAALLVALATIVDAGNSRVVRQLSKGGPITAIRVVAAEPDPAATDSDNPRPGQPKDLDTATVARIRRLPDVAEVAPVLAAQVLAVPPTTPRVDGHWPPTFVDSAVGIDLAHPSRLPITVVAGRLPAPNARGEVAVTQAYVERLHLDPKHPDAVLGTEVQLGSPMVDPEGGGFRFRGRWVRERIVGVVAQEVAPGQFVTSLDETRRDRAWALRGTSDGNDFRLPTSEYSGLVVTATSLDSVGQVRRAITDLGYSTSAPEQLIATVQRYLHVVDIVLGSIALIALVIAALGIASTMAAAVRERRREIGILKAIGGRDSDVARWFLVEAALVGVIGGAAGTALGITIARVVGSVVNGYLTQQGLTGVRVAVPLLIAVVGVAGSLVMAVLAGGVPALRAARLPAREAMGA